MTALTALILGLVQGLTEFLPVSSSGHLVIAEELLGAQHKGILFEIALHVATLLAIVIVYRRRILELLVGALRGDPAAWRYQAKLVLGTLPAVALVLVAGDLLEAQFKQPAVSGVGLLVTGVLLWTTRRTLPHAHAPEPSWAAAFLIGCAQAVAIVPGISRSGSTVVAALALGVAPLVAAEFSFLLGVVAIAGAAVKNLGGFEGISPDEVSALAVGCAAALVSGVGAIWLFLRLLRSQHFYRFAYYLWPAGTLFLLWLALG